MDSLKKSELFGCALILAGGKSSRMGFDKQLIKVDGNILSLENIKKLSLYFNNVFVATKTPYLYRDTGTIIVNDILEDSGPLSGILSALVLCKSQYLFVCTCDSEIPSLDVISYFADIAKETNAMVVASTDKNFIYPFNAFYSKEIITPLAEFLLKGGRKIQDFLEQIKCQYIPRKEIERKFKKIAFKNRNYIPSDAVDEKLDIITTTARAVRVNETEKSEFYDFIVKEKIFKIFINNNLQAVLNISPVDLEELVIGYLFTQGHINDMSEMKSIWIIESEADIKTETNQNRQHTKKTDITFNYQDIINLSSKFLTTSQVFEKTGAIHSCAVCAGNEILYFFEDIGRHNAIDKAVGACVINGGIKPEMFLLTSGRLPIEIVKKANNAGFSLIVSRSAPTDIAIDYAKKNDICIVGFSRNKRFNVYSNMQKINFTK